MGEISTKLCLGIKFYNNFGEHRLDFLMLGHAMSFLACIYLLQVLVIFKVI